MSKQNEPYLSQHYGFSVGDESFLETVPSRESQQLNPPRTIPFNNNSYEKKRWKSAPAKIFDEDDDFFLNEVQDEGKELFDLESNLEKMILNSNAGNTTNLNYKKKEGKADPYACVFVASLCMNTDQEVLLKLLTEHFSKWGELKEVKLKTDSAKRPFSFIQYKHIEDAKRALKENKNTHIAGRLCRVEPAKVNRTLNFEERSNYYFLKRNLDFFKEDFKKFFEKNFGLVEDLKVFEDPKKNKNFGFVMFRFREDALKAYTTLKNGNFEEIGIIEWTSNLEEKLTIQQIQNQQRQFQLQQLQHFQLKKQQEHQQQLQKEMQQQQLTMIPTHINDEFDSTCSNSLYIGQLNQNLITRETLKYEFEKFGKIVSIYLVNRYCFGEEDSKPAFAFIKYEKREDAIMAKKTMNGILFLNKNLKIEFNNQEKEKREYEDMHYFQTIQNNLNNNNLLERNELNELYNLEKEEKKEIQYVGQRTPTRVPCYAEPNIASSHQTYTGNAAAFSPQRPISSSPQRLQTFSGRPSHYISLPSPQVSHSGSSSHYSPHKSINQSPDAFSRGPYPSPLISPNRNNIQYNALQQSSFRPVNNYSPRQEIFTHSHLQLNSRELEQKIDNKFSSLPPLRRNLFQNPQTTSQKKENFNLINNPRIENFNQVSSLSSQTVKKGPSHISYNNDSNENSKNDFSRSLEKF